MMQGGTLTLFQNSRQPQLPQLRFHTVNELRERSLWQTHIPQGHKAAVCEVFTGELAEPLAHIFLGFVGEEQTHIASQSLQDLKKRFTHSITTRRDRPSKKN